MTANIKVFHRGLILVVVPLLAGIFVLACLSLVVVETDKEVAYGQLNKRIERDVSIMAAAMYHVGYELECIVRDGRFDEMSTVLDQLRLMVSIRKDLREIPADPNDHDYVEASQDVSNLMALMSKVLRPFLGHRGNVEVAVNQALGEKERLTDVVSQSYGWLQKLLSKSRDEMIEASYRKQEQLRQLQAAILLAGLVSSVALAFVLARFFMRGIVRRLSVITENAKRLGAGLPLNPRLSGGDEISELDGAFHEMADELQRVAERERALFDNASDVICVLDRSGLFTRVNPASQRIWCRNPGVLLGTTLLDLVIEEDRPLVAAALHRAQIEDPSCQFECRLSCGDGQLMESLWQVYWAEGEESLFCVAHDISDRKRVERMKQDFLAMVSHDLRSPLTSIATVFELLHRGTLGELTSAAGDRVSIARRNVSRLLSMVNDLLDVEKLEAGQLTLSLEPVEIQGLLTRCIQEVEPVATQRGVTLNLESCPGEARLDCDRIVQVIVNLLSNAIKFSPDKGVVTLSARMAGEDLEIAVKDQGRGVPVAARSAIFERFKQAEAADGRRKSGTGLGLPICKQLVELHGGTIGVDSEPGQGSTFWLRLPLSPSLKAQVEAGSAAGVRERDGGAVPYKDAADRGAVIVGAGTASPPGRLSPEAQLTVSGFRFSPLEDLSLFFKGVLLVGVPVVFELLLAGLLILVLVQVNKEKNYEHYLHSISFGAAECVGDFLRMGRAMGDKHSVAAWQDFEAAALDCTETVKHLRELVSREPALASNFAATEKAAKSGLDMYQQAKERMKGLPPSEFKIVNAFDDTETLAPVADQVGQQMIAMLAKLDALQSTSPERQAALRHQQGILLMSGVALNVLLSLSLALFFAKGITLRLSALRDNVRRLARDEQLSAPLTGRDEIAQLDKVFRNMAVALKEARHKEQAVFDNSQDVICAVDAPGTFKQINSACKRMWGFEPDQLLGTSFLSLVAPVDRELLAARLESARAVSAVTYFENCIACHDGAIKDTLWSANWSNQKALLFCVAHDITKRKELERLKQEFLAMVSHELRTPLTAVNGVARLMLAGALGPFTDAARIKLELVVASVDRLVDLINDLLDMEKLEAGQMQLAIEPTSVRSMLERSVQALEGLAKEKNVEVLVSASEIEILADGERMIQAIVNLLSNAIKFSPEGGTVTLSAESADGVCELKVTDQGRGIPAEHRETIFERFKQVEAADGKRTRGTGLGLPIVKKIIEGHGGKVSVVSEPGKGTTFCVRIAV